MLLPQPKPRVPLRARSLALLLAACVTGLVTVASAGEQDATSGGASAPQAGLKVNVDPKTGRFLETPPPDSDPGAAAGRAAAAAPLVVEPSPVPGGGIGFRVSDQRYNAELKATTAPDGSAHVACDAPAK